jgi:hypothetical protein
LGAPSIVVGSVYWGSGPLAFELRSPDADILEGARLVFDAWRPSADAQLVESFCARWTNDEIVVEPRPSVEGRELRKISSVAHAVAVVEYAAIGQIVDTCDHVLCFHAALLYRDGKSAALVGPSHSGKSTLAAGLWQSGWDFLCDDLVIVAGRKAMPGPRRVSLRHASRPLLGERLWSQLSESRGQYKHADGWMFQPMYIDGGEKRSVDLDALFFLKRNGAPADINAHRLTPAHAAMSLLPYTNLVRTQSFPTALAPVAELMSRTAAWDLARAPLPEMIATVNRLVSEER